MNSNKEKDDEVLPTGPGGAEFADRVTRLLITAVEGICSLLPEAEPLREKLNSLALVLKKAIRLKPITDLGKEIQDYFARKKLEDDFRVTERAEMKEVLVDLAQALKEMVVSSGGFGEEVATHLDKIQKADDLMELRTIKEILVVDLQKMRNQSLSLKRELENHRETITSLNKRLEQSQAQALVDTLTSTLNRGAYDLKIGQLIREFVRYKDSTALMVVDIDYFKRFNDSYGHKAGDRVLASVAASIKDTIRSSDMVFRYGGEEFVILLNKTSSENAEKLAEKIRLRVEKDYFVDGALTLKVTVSVGLTCLKEGDTEHTLFERADKAMYDSKHKGRNRVTRID